MTTAVAKLTICEPLVQLTVDLITSYHGPLNRNSAEVALGNWQFKDGLSDADREAILGSFPVSLKGGLVLVP